MLPLTSLQITSFLCLLIRKTSHGYLDPSVRKDGMALQRSGRGGCSILLEDECPAGAKMTATKREDEKHMERDWR